MTIAEVLKKATEGGYHINGSDGVEISYIGANDEYSAWTRTEVTDKMQVFAYDALTGQVLWKFEETCKPGTRGPGLVTGSGLPITFNKEECIVIHGNRQWKILRLADGKQVWLLPGTTADQPAPPLPANASLQ